MSGEIDPEHPRVELFFYVVDGSKAASHEDIARLIVDLTLERDWLTGPPEFVHTIEADEESEEPLETLGGAFELFSAFPPYVLPIDVDRRQLEEVETILSTLQEYSRATGVEFDVMFNGESIGTVERGKISDELRSIFLDPWRETLAARPENMGTP